MPETIEGQLAYIEIALKHAKDNTTGHTQHQIIRSLMMFSPLRAGIQNLKARCDTLEEQE